MDKRTLLFDIDGTICPQAKSVEGYRNLEPFREAIAVINKLYDEGYKIIFYTSRFMGYNKGDVIKVYRTDGYAFTRKQLEDWGVKFHELHMGKPQSHLIIDDRSIFYEDDWKRIYEKIKLKIKDYEMTREIKDKVKTIEEIGEISKKLREEGKVIVTTNGSFDILHLAHVNLLEKAKQTGDVLIVLINSDASIKRNKGEKRPIVPEQERARILAAFESVDYVVIFNEDKPFQALEKIRAQIHVKGIEVVGETRDFIKKWGGEYKTMGLEQGLSTTNIINKILESYKS